MAMSSSSPGNDAMTHTIIAAATLLALPVGTASADDHCGSSYGATQAQLFAKPGRIGA
jgi:hypothetical protein